MEIGIQPVTAFARFFEATPGNSVKVVRDARLFQSDPGSYIKRAYYGPFLSALKQTHWKGTDLATFESKLEDVVMEIAGSNSKGRAAKEKRYRDLGKDYITYWQQYPDSQPFEVPEAVTAIAKLRLCVTAELGIRVGSDEFALEPYFRLPQPTRLYRQAIQHITQQARQNVWHSDWIAAIYDVDRKTRLPDICVNPRDLGIALQGAAANFIQIWNSIEL